MKTEQAIKAAAFAGEIDETTVAFIMVKSSPRGTELVSSGPLGELCLQSMVVQQYLNMVIKGEVPNVKV